MSTHVVFTLADPSKPNPVRTKAVIIPGGYAYGEQLAEPDFVRTLPSKVAEEFAEVFRAMGPHEVDYARVSKESVDALSVLDVISRFLSPPPRNSNPWLNSATAPSLSVTVAQWSLLADNVTKGLSTEAMLLKMESLLTPSRLTLSAIIEDPDHKLSWADIGVAHIKKCELLGTYEGLCMSRVAIPVTEQWLIAKFTAPKWVRDPDQSFDPASAMQPGIRAVAVA